MSEQEFKSWREIDKFQGVHVIITEKIHGSNAQILVYRDESGALKALAGSRTQFLDPWGRDNFGFAKYVMAHEAQICEQLGEGRHYGEWVGPGVNSDYGLKDKHLVLFDFRRHPKEKFEAGQMPPNMLPIPVLYDGPYAPGIEDKVMDGLKANGSVLSPGFMKPEGVVLFFPQFGSMKKKVFKAEETGWTKKGKEKDPNAGPKVNYLEVARPFLQPIRLEKLLMRDETFRKEFPKNLPTIVRAYLADLQKETPDMTEEQLTAVKKKVFEFVKEEVEANLASNPVVEVSE